MQKLAKLGRLLDSICSRTDATQKGNRGPIDGPAKKSDLIYLSPRSARTKSRYDLIELQKAIDLAG